MWRQAKKSSEAAAGPEYYCVLKRTRRREATPLFRGIYKQEGEKIHRKFFGWSYDCLKSVFYKNNLENPSAAIKISMIGPHNLYNQLIWS